MYVDDKKYDFVAEILLIVLKKEGLASLMVTKI